MTVPLSLSSVPAVLPYIQYVATGGQTVYPYPFPITQDADLVVVINGVTQGTDSGYTLSGQGNATGGNVTLNAGSTASDIITLFRNIAVQRITQIGQNSGFSSAAFNAEFNNIYLILQQLQESIALSLQIPNTNSPAPVTTLAAGYANKYLAFDASGNPTPAALTTSGSVTGALIAGLLNLITGTAPTADKVRTAAEITAGAVPVNFSVRPGDPNRFVAAGYTWGSSASGDTAALTTWASVGGDLVVPANVTALINAAIPLVSNTTINGTLGAVIKTATADINLFQASTKNHITVRGLHFKQTVAGSAVTGGVYLDTCSDCVVENCEFEGMQFAGVWSQAATRCTFRGNYCHDPLGGGQDSCDIYVASSVSAPARYNVIDGNFCYGTTFEFGVAVWDPYAGNLPLHNVVTNNRIGAHNGYGILIYMPDAGDSYTQVIGNHVQDISAHSTTPDAGAGIYLSGQGIGGTQVIGNTINNCCITTSSTSLAPAGIGVNQFGAPAGGVPLVISGNTIEGMTKYHGILLTACIGGASVTGNTIRHPLSNATGEAISVTNSSNVSVMANNILMDVASLRRAIFINAQGAACTNVSIIGNTVNSGNRSQIETSQTGGNLVTGLTISGNICTGGGNSCIPLDLVNTTVADATVTGNYFSAGNATAITQTGCTNVRYANNRVKGTGAVILSFTGTNTGSYYDKTNFGSGTGAGVVNSGTGLIIEQLGSAAPVAGTWAVGDRVEQSVPVVGNPKGWRCTVAGAPGTQVSEGNL